MFRVPVKGSGEGFGVFLACVFLGLLGGFASGYL